MKRLVFALILLLHAGVALAGSRVASLDLELLPPALEPVEGADFDVVLRITSRGASSFQLLSLGSDDGGWLERGRNAAVHQLSDGQTFDLTLQLTCLDLHQPFHVVYLENGRRQRRDFFAVSRAENVGVEAPEGVIDRGKVAPASETVPDPLPTPKVSPRDRMGERTPDLDDREDATRAKGVVTVVGQIVYQRWGLEWVGAEGVTVHMWDEDSGADDYLGSAVTNSLGLFSVTFFSTELPDIYIEYSAGNAKVEVQAPTFFEPVYTWVTPTVKNVANVGTVVLPDYTAINLLGRQVLHQITSVTRAWKWLTTVQYGHIDDVDVLFPDSDWPYYESFEEEIHLPSGWGWNDGTMWHEYGHHWVDDFGDQYSSEYCNSGGRCDDGEDDCGHCTWCEENEGVGWSEGMAQFFADRISHDVETDYGWQDAEPIDGRDFETNDKCYSGSGGSNEYDDPAKTEGALAGLLIDLADSAVDSDPRGGGRSKDTAQFGSHAVLAVAQQAKPRTPWEFLIAFRNAYPGSLTGIWNAAWNNGYNFDNTKPGIVGNLVSTSHALFGDSPDDTIDFEWTKASDDISGIWGYSIFIAGTPTLPDKSVDILAATSGTQESYTTGNLGPGTYYFSVRAQDKAGNWSDAYAAFGPVTVRDPYPADLAAQHHPQFFDAPIVPSNTTMPSGQGNIPQNLYPVLGTYFNLQLANNGELATTGSLDIRMFLDGDTMNELLIPWSNPLNGLSYRAWNDIGPFTVPAGRHTVGYWADANEELAEADELDNRHVGQWVWSLPSSAPGTTPGLAVSRPAPPWVHAGGGIEANCDGVSLATEQGFGGLVVRTNALDDDYDVVLHNKSTGPAHGFSLSTKILDSQRGAGLLDGVFYNGFQVRAAGYDVGVERWASDRLGDFQGFSALPLSSSEIFFDQTATISWAEEEMVTLLHFDLPPAEAGEVEVILTTDRVAGKMWVRVFDGSNNHYNLHNMSDASATGADGVASELESLAADKHGIAVWRDPIDSPGGVASATTWTVHVRRARPDIGTHAPPGWIQSIVPYPTATGTLIQVPMPDQLDGNASTWFNVARRNYRPNDAGLVFMEERVDGAVLMSRTVDMDGYETFALNNLGPFVVAGGRHTVSQRIDPLDVVDEHDETNNESGVQWAWSGLPLAVGTAVTRPAPPDPTGGWEDVDYFGALYFNSDGLVLPEAVPQGQDGFWQAIAVVPGAGSDVDLRLHEPDASLFGTWGAFGETEVTSEAGPGMIDFVLTNHRQRVDRAYDVSVVGAEGSEDYDASAVASVWLGDQPAGTFGPHALAAGEVLDLWEVNLAAGRHVFELANLQGRADLGISLHAGSATFGSRHATVPRAVSWVEGAGRDESIFVDLPSGGVYCIAVWKVSRGDAPIAASYSLSIDDGVTTVEAPSSDLTTRGLVGAWPNPFNPRTALHFELAAPEDITLDIFDLRGRRVIQLASGRWAAGRHELVWDGTDERGRRVTSGVYVASLETSHGKSRLKLSLVK